MAEEFEVIKFEIAKLEVKPGDVLVLKIKSRMPMAEHERIASGLKNVVPEGVKVIILDGRDVELSIVSMQNELE